MAKLDLSYDIINGQPASASPVDANFDRVEQYVNQELIERDGTVGMRAQLRLFADPVAPLDAATKQYVDAVLPVGIIMMYGGAAVPPGGRWAICNGAELQESEYPTLFAVLGTTYGGTAGRFNLPNLTDRFARGGTPGATGGTKDAVIVTHTHDTAVTVPVMTVSTTDINHTHDTGNHLHAFSGSTGGASADHSHYMKGYGTSVTSTGGGFGEGLVADISSGVYAPAFNTSGHSADHGHNFSGTTAGMTAGAATGAMNSNNTHNHTTPATAASGTASAPAGAVVGTDQNLPPYLGVTHIIRVS